MKMSWVISEMLYLYLFVLLHWPQWMFFEETKKRRERSKIYFRLYGGMLESRWWTMLYKQGDLVQCKRSEWKREGLGVIDGCWWEKKGIRKKNGIVGMHGCTWLVLEWRFGGATLGMMSWYCGVCKVKCWELEWLQNSYFCHFSGYLVV